LHGIDGETRHPGIGVAGVERGHVSLAGRSRASSSLACTATTGSFLRDGRISGGDAGRPEDLDSVAGRGLAEAGDVRGLGRCGRYLETLRRLARGAKERVEGRGLGHEQEARLLGRDHERVRDVARAVDERSRRGVDNPAAYPEGQLALEDV